MKYLYSLLFLFMSFTFYAQEKKPKKSLRKESNDSIKSNKAKIDLYKIVSLEKDTIIVDTTLSIKKEYEYNYLRKDLFGLMPSSNEGKAYNTLNFSLNKFNPFPEIGFKAKHINYYEINDVNYYSVPTPLSELYYKSVMEQGQSVDALITVNTSERFNISIAFRGLRSLGKYINELTSNGNFTFTTSYRTKNNRYATNFHFTGQDLSNGENGGITSPENFESEDNDFKNRARLQVYLRDAKSFLKGKRYFIDHSFRINSENTNNNILITHQLNYETKFFEYSQTTLRSSIDGETDFFNRYGDSYLAANGNTQVNVNLKDQARYNKFYNKVGAVYESALLGKFQFFIDDYRSNYYYDKVLILQNDVISNKLTNKINTIGGQYEYQKNKWNGKFLYSNSISQLPLRNLDAHLTYKINDKNNLTFQYQNISKLPDNNYSLNQSSYINYNWSNDFKNEKINNIIANANTQWVSASLQISSFNDYLYFADKEQLQNQQLIKPYQYDKTINYLSVKVSREFKFRKFALDNTILYQKVDQQDNILNVPELTLRHTLYYTNRFFKRNLQVQTGIIANYFTKYYANDYNPIVGEFFTQTNKEIGDFPMLDFFINARIRQTRIFLKAEHFNSSFTGNTFYSTPNMPYHDFMVRIGVVWTFFQ